ncbi:hypothetical protein LJB88_00125 [Erysipelotrichaceae bacterium OttesenSCG-928-M19]|nr:hypothetical protein [Erysipelotrichaceae bacterium OttesenSCG-928-M19]
MKKDFYSSKANEVTKKILSYERQSKKLSLVRFIVFVCFALTALLTFYENNILYLAPALLSLVIFLYIVKKHSKVEANLAFEKSMVSVLNDYLARFNNEWQSFEKTGIELLKEDDYLSKDLDIVGNNSLFQYLSLTKSKSGAQKLYQRLTAKKLFSDGSAISELANNNEWHLILTSIINQYDSTKSELDLNDGKLLNRTEYLIYNLLANIYPLFIALNIILVIFNVLSGASILIMVLINALIILLRFKKNKEFLGNSLAYNSNLGVILKLLKQLEQYDAKSNKLQELLKGLKDERATQAIKKLIKLKERIESESNFLMYLLAELFLMWDYRNVLTYHKWKQSLGKNINEYLELFYEMEVLLSLGVIEQTKEIVTSSSVTLETKPKLEICQIYHPLIAEDRVIANDFSCTQQTTLITGSNMSGKTTFIRCLGINLVLAYAGASVCATTFKTSYLTIFTSIRVEDNLNDGISTFYAEIQRIKQMIEALNKQQPMLCLIDEIFKGTNSEDRIYGAKKTIEALSKPFVISFITTHDAQLCELAEVVNFHFKEYFKNDEIKFDYLINPGMAQTRNAKYLLKLAGIII